MKTTMMGKARITKTAFTMMVEQLFAENPVNVGNQGTLRSVIGTCFASMSQTQHTWKREAFRDLLLHMETQGCYALLRNAEAIHALANIACFGNKLARPIDCWEKESGGAEEQLSALIRHCFAQYEVSSFMESAFFFENKIHMLWYIQLGRGDSVFELKGFPVNFTRKMAHEFKNAPSGYNIHQAIRWAQGKGFGASGDMCEAFAWSILTEGFENEDFWETVIRFLSKYEVLAFNEIQDVLHYLKSRLEENKMYSMKGRTWEALLRQANEWHVECSRRLAASSRADWVTSGISSFSKDAESPEGLVIYTIVELTTSEALYEEGYEMSHCVAEYEYDCSIGVSAIFSLRKKYAGEELTLATIEVGLESKSVVQAKAKYNEDISAEATGILEEWALKEGLALDYDEFDAFPAQENPVAAAPKRELSINWVLVCYMILLLAKACANCG